jgi:hypothetical protein
MAIMIRPSSKAMKITSKILKIPKKAQQRNDNGTMHDMQLRARMNRDILR